MCSRGFGPVLGPFPIQRCSRAIIQVCELRAHSLSHILRLIRVPMEDGREEIIK